MTNKKGFEPLLFIAQPLLEKPAIQMEKMHVERGAKKGKTYRRPSLDVSFHDLRVEEQIHYLLALPRGIARMRCEIRTQDSLYRGTVTKRENDSIMIHVLGRGEEHVEVASIKQIRLISL